MVDFSSVGAVDGRFWVKDGDGVVVPLFLDVSLSVAVGQPVWVKNGYVVVGGNVVELFSPVVDVVLERVV